MILTDFDGTRVSDFVYLFRKLYILKDWCLFLTSWTATLVLKT